MSEHVSALTHEPDTLVGHLNFGTRQMFDFTATTGTPHVLTGGGHPVVIQPPPLPQPR
jgi:hypothetical protein